MNKIKRWVISILVIVVWMIATYFYRQIIEKDTRIGNLTSIIDSLTSNPYYPLEWLGLCAISKYTASVDETDNTPHLTAYMYKLMPNDYNRIGACNFLPYGTKVFVDSIGWITIVDKMNRRYQTSIDIFCKTKKEAKEWGVRIKSVWLLKKEGM